MTELVISSEPDASPQDTAVISDGLDSFNLQASGHSTYSPVVLLARDPEGGVRGGLLGHVWGGWLHVRYFWVAEAWRGQGFGRGSASSGGRGGSAGRGEASVSEHVQFSGPRVL